MVHDEVRGDVVFANDSIEDFVLLRGNGSPVFLLANVIDDVEMHISHVIRAEEHLPNTPKQQLLWEALGHQPPIWAHVPVVVNEQRKKLSKRRDKVALEGYRDEGFLAPAMVNYLMTLGWAPKGETEIVPWSEIERDFRFEDVTHSPAFFDIKKLTAFNGEYIRCTDGRRVHRRLSAVRPRGGRAVAGRALRPGSLRLDGRARPDARRRRSARCRRWSTSCSSPTRWSISQRRRRRSTVLAATSSSPRARPTPRSTEWNPDALKESLEAVGTQFGLKLGKAQAPIRVAVTGRSVGPPLFESLELLGRDETLRRLRALLEAVPA